MAKRCGFDVEKQTAAITRRRSKTREPLFRAPADSMPLLGARIELVRRDHCTLVAKTR